MAHKPAGGSGSRVVKSGKGHTPGRATNTPYHHATVSRIGQSMGNHATERGGKTLPNKVPVVTSHPFQTGPNTSSKATVHGCGTQSQYGSAAGTPAPQGRDILSSFGPDSAGVRGRR